MTGTPLVEDGHAFDVSPEGLQRVLDLSRRALRARDVSIMPPDHTVPDAEDGSDRTLAASVSLDGVSLATLVAIDASDRSFSDDDRAMLVDLAAVLAMEVQLRGECRRPAPGVGERDDVRPEPALDGASNLSMADVASIDDGEGGETLRILLADDLDLNRKLICDMLSIDGYTCDSVADGAAAVEAVKCGTYDLVLMDMIMPGMDGMEATRAIRALPSPLCDVPIVALTAHSFREQLDNCLRAGMNATLTKPMSFESLSAAVSTWARQRQAA